MPLTKLIAIVGPTASGKTKLGIVIAKHVEGEVISVDSRQIYRGMDIGTGKVVGSEQEGVVHWGIDLVNPDETYSVADFKMYAEQKIEEIIARGHVPILVGGTGLWIDALIKNFDLTQTAGDFVLRAELEKRSTEDLFSEYQQLDPVGAEVIDKENVRRLVRAIEVTRVTGKPFSQQQTKGEFKYDVLKIGLLVERDVLNKRIDARVDVMMVNGLLDEVRTLKTTYGCDIPAMSGIGYRQLCECIDGNRTVESAIEEMKKATRHYAKRQMTWFKRDQQIHWIKTSNEAMILVRSFRL